jgi:5-methylcytosine-specific restriction endonuclease McrA
MAPKSRTAQAAWINLRARLIRTRPHICYWCGATLDPRAKPHTSRAIEPDHIVPVRTRPDLEYEPTNIVLACHPCNRKKGDREAPRPDLGGRPW